MSARKPSVPNVAPKRTGSMTPRTTAAAANAAAARPASGTQKKEPVGSKSSPSPPPSSQAASRPNDTPKPPAAAAAAAHPPLTSLSDFTEYFNTKLSLLTDQPAGGSSTQLFGNGLAAGILDSVGKTTTKSDGSNESSTAISVIPNEAVVHVQKQPAAGSSSSDCSVSVCIEAGIAGKTLATSSSDASEVVLTPLNSAAGTRDPLRVSWTGAKNWSVKSSELTMSGQGSSSGGVTVQRGNVKLSTNATTGSASIDIRGASTNVSKVAVAASSLLLCPNWAQSGPQKPETFTHAGDESVTSFIFGSPALSSSSSAPPPTRPQSATIGASLRKTKVDIMDGLASFNGDVDWNTKRFQGLGTFSAAMAPSQTAKYEGGWVDSLRHGSAGTWKLSLSSDESSAMQSVEYVGGWHRDARHGAGGRLSIRGAIGIHIDADWDHGELHKAATVSSIADTQTIVKCHFDAGSLAQKVTLSFPTGQFVGTWSSPKDATILALSLGSERVKSSLTHHRVPPVEMLTTNMSGVTSSLQRVTDAMGAVDCCVQNVLNPLLSDHVRGPVAEVLAARVATVLAQQAAGAMVDAKRIEMRETILEGVRQKLKKAKQRLAECEDTLSKSERKLVKSRSGLEAATRDRDKLQSQVDREQQLLEQLESQSSGDASSNRSNLSAKLKELNAEKSSLDDRLAALNEELTVTRSEVRKASQRRDTMQKELKAMETEIQQISEKTAPINDAIDAQATKLLQVEQESAAYLEKMEVTKKSLTEQLQEMQRRLNDPDDGSSSASLGGEMSDMATQIRTLKQESSTLKAQIEELERQRQCVISEEQELNKAASQARRTNADVDAEMQRLSEGIHASKLAMEAKASEIATLQQLLEAKRQRLATIGQEGFEDPTEFKSTIAELENRMSSLTAASSASRSSMTKKMLELDALREENTALKDEIEKAKRIPMVPPVVEAEASVVPPNRQPVPPPVPPRTPTPPPDPRINALESTLKDLLSKQETLRKKRENIKERNDQLVGQKETLEAKQRRRAKEEEEAEAAALVRTSSQSIAQSHDNGIMSAIMADGSISELKAFLSKMKEQNAQYEDENQKLRGKLDALTSSLNELKKLCDASPASTQSNAVDWRTKALQDEVDLREAKINSLRNELKRVHLLEAKIQSAKETVKTLNQSVELRQTQAAQMAKADLEWSSSTNYARRASSISGKNAFF